MARKVDAVAVAAKRGEKFRRVAAKRTRGVMAELVRLGRCADRTRYEYTAEEAAKVLTAVDASVETLRQKFVGVKEAAPEFTL